MSYAHYFVKNFKLSEVINLFCYNTRFPHTLTSTQKITRMYTCIMRRQKALTINQNRGDIAEYHEMLRIARGRFDRLMEISESSAQFKETLEEYEKWLRDTMEPTILFKQCRPYSATSGKYYVFNNEQLSRDPYGYYSGAPVGGNQHDKLGHLFYQNFPYDSKGWDITPPHLDGSQDIDQSYSAK